MTPTPVPTQAPDPIIALLRRMLLSRAAFHMRHLLTPAYAEHVALGGLYEALDGLIDRLGEEYVGAHPEVRHGVPIPDSSDPAVQELASLIQDIERQSVDSADDPVLSNLLEETAGSLRGQIMLLRLK